MHPDQTTIDPSQQAAEATTGLTAETLIEEVSIDGMCGVY